MPKKVSKEDKIYAHPVCLKANQIDWLNNHAKFDFNKFVRGQLDKYIQLKEEIKNIDKTTK